MRPLAIVLLLLLAAFAVVPTASASEVPPLVCGPTAMCTGPAVDPCGSRDMCNDAGCPYPVGAEDGTTVKAAGATVGHDCGPQSLCSGPMRCTSPLESAWLPVCIQPQVEQGPVRAGVDQCRQDHETFPACSSAQRIHHYEQVLVLWAQVHVCLPHSPPPTLSAAAIAPPVPPVCGPDMLCQGPECTAQTIASETDHHNSVTVNRDCTVHIVTGYGQICVGAWTGHQQHVVGPITWDRYYCSFPGGQPDLLDISATTAQPGPCGAADPMQRCPAPVPLCSGVKDPMEGAFDIDIAPNCHVTVSADFIDCLWGETWTTHSAGPVTVRYTTCSSPYEEA